nr:5192_t:CDS:2 [Entrophospora candida]
MVFPDSISFPFHSLKITSSWLDPKTFKNYGEILANSIWQTHNIIKENKLPLEEPESLDEFYELKRNKAFHEYSLHPKKLRFLISSSFCTSSFCTSSITSSSLYTSSITSDSELYFVFLSLLTVL